MDTTDRDSEGSPVAHLTLDTAMHGYAGPCALCGRPDKRHRLWDAVRGSHRAGDGVAAIAWDYDLTPEGVQWIIDQPRFPGRRRAA